MPFTPEDGTGLADANAFGDVAGADAYFADRGNSTWAGLTTTAKEQALVKATDFIDRKYWKNFRGTRLVVTQNLSWPRTGAYYGGDYTRPIAEDEVPSGVLQAMYELALRSLADDLAPDVTTASGSVIKEKVGSLEVEYAEGRSIAQPYYSVAVDALRPYLTGNPNVVEVVRA